MQKKQCSLKFFGESEKKENTVATRELFVMEKNVTHLTKIVDGLENQLNVAEEKLFTDGEQFAENKTGKILKQENNVVKHIKDVH